MERENNRNTLTRDRTSSDVEITSPRKFQVVLHNDDYTTMEFVVFVLRTFFGKSNAEANRLMLQVHQKGQAVGGVYPRQIAETKVTEVTREARQNEMPLLVTSEPTG